MGVDGGGTLREVRLTGVGVVSVTSVRCGCFELVLFLSPSSALRFEPLAARAFGGFSFLGLISKLLNSVRSSSPYLPNHAQDETLPRLTEDDVAYDMDEVLVHQENVS